MKLPRDTERISRIQQALNHAQLDALVCTRPSNVLLLTGYWPVIGCSIAIATRDGRVMLIVPDDEYALAQRSWSDELRTFPGGSLQEIKTKSDSAREPLVEIATRLNLFSKGVVGFESEDDHQPASYASMHTFAPIVEGMLEQAFYGTKLIPADRLISSLRSSLTTNELARLRLACEIAKDAYLSGVEQIQTGIKENEVANWLRAPLAAPKSDAILRADGFVYCMSGSNAADAHAAYQWSRTRRLEENDFVLIHCNSRADGFWTDITRTYVLGSADSRKRKILEALLNARDAALKKIKPGVKASEVDRAARETMKQHGFEKEFKHPTGHGVGFVAIDHSAPPMLHPKSEDILEVGVVFNVEPGFYEEGFGGARHCDMVLVTPGGAEVLSHFHDRLEDLILSPDSIETRFQGPSRSTTLHVKR